MSHPDRVLELHHGDPDGPEPERLLTAAEVARILGVRPKRVYELGIPSVRLSERSRRWRPAAVAQWIAEREDDTGGQP